MSLKKCCGCTRGVGRTDVYRRREVTKEYDKKDACFNVNNKKSLPTENSVQLV